MAAREELQVFDPILLQDLIKKCLAGDDLGDAPAGFEAELSAGLRMAKITIDEKGLVAKDRGPPREACGGRGFPFPRQGLADLAMDSWQWLEGESLDYHFYWEQVHRRFSTIQPQIDSHFFVPRTGNPRACVHPRIHQTT